MSYIVYVSKTVQVMIEIDDSDAKLSEEEAKDLALLLAAGDKDLEWIDPNYKAWSIIHTEDVVS